MRPTFVFFMISVAVLALAGAILYKKHAVVISQVVTVTVPVTNPPAPAPAPVAVAPAPAAPVKNNLTPEQREQVIHQETERLAVLAMNNDQASLSTILGDLTSPEKEIRMAAIESAKQFGSTNAIPVLKAMAEQSSDPEEITALSEAAEFLSLPDANLVGEGNATKVGATPPPSGGPKGD